MDVLRSPAAGSGRGAGTLVLAAVGCALLLSGCAAGGPRAGGDSPAATPAPAPSSTPAAPGTTTPPDPAPPTPTPSSRTPVPPAKEAAGVTVVRTGGFAGVSQTLTVRKDGTWSFTQARDAGGGTPQTGRLTMAQQAQLQALLTDPGIATEAGRTAAPPKCNDGFHYTMKIGKMTIEWDDCASSTPRLATQIVHLLSAATPL